MARWRLTRINNMLDVKKIQQEILANKVAKGFNTTDVYLELCHLHDELGEVFRAYRKKLPDLGEELADVAIYLLGLAELLKIDLEAEVLKKVAKNKAREVEMVNGVVVHKK